MSEKIKLSMNVQGITPSLFETGKVKIGRKGSTRQGQNGPYQLAEKLDHFLVTTTIRGSDNNFLEDTALMDSLKKDSDGKLRRIPITLLYDDLGLNFQSQYKSYIGKTLFCSGDGVNANRAFSSKTDRTKVGGYEPCKCICERAEFGYQGKDKCKITGRLQFIIRGAERIGGVHIFRTTSRNSVVSMLSSLSMIQRITNGHMAGIPLELVVSPKLTTDPEGKQQTIYVVSIEFMGSMQVLQETVHQLHLANAEYGIQIGRIEEEARALLSAQPSPFPDELDDDDHTEFFPSQAPSELPEAGKPTTSTQTALGNLAKKAKAEKPTVEATVVPPVVEARPETKAEAVKPEPTPEKAEEPEKVAEAEPVASQDPGLVLDDPFGEGQPTASDDDQPW